MASSPEEPVTVVWDVRESSTADRECDAGCQECSSLTPILKHILQHLSDRTQHEDSSDLVVEYEGYKQRLSWHFECEWCNFKSFYKEDMLTHKRTKHPSGRPYVKSLIKKTGSSQRYIRELFRGKRSASDVHERPVKAKRVPPVAPVVYDQAKLSKAMGSSKTSPSKGASGEDSKSAVASTSVDESTSTCIVDKGGDDAETASATCSLENIEGETVIEHTETEEGDERTYCKAPSAFDDNGVELDEVTSDYPFRSQFNCLVKRCLQDEGFWNANYLVADLEADTLSNLVNKIKSYHPVVSRQGIIGAIKLKLRNKQYDTLKRRKNASLL